MENASKALIIAGAILLAILIISLGIFIFNQASEITKSNNLNEVEILNFNEKFKSFEGENVRGGEVNSLLNRVVQNNVANQTDESKQVDVTIDSTPYEKKLEAIPKVQTGKTYKVECKTDKKTGLVTTVEITTIKSASGN